VYCFFIAFDASRVSSEERVEHQQSMYIFLSFAKMNYLAIILVIQFNGSQSEKIRIKCNPRSKFRPRFEKESKDSTHYIRCEDHIQPQHPTIYV
jgi:hypothetical protein